MRYDMRLTGVVSLLCPGRRLLSCGCMSASVSGRLGGTPSTMTPTPLPCDSPKVVIRNRVPKEDIAALQSNLLQNEKVRCNKHYVTEGVLVVLLLL